jgi:hypothetical protein
MDRSKFGVKGLDKIFTKEELHFYLITTFIEIDTKRNFGSMLTIKYVNELNKKINNYSIGKKCKITEILIPIERALEKHIHENSNKKQGPYRFRYENYMVPTNNNFFCIYGECSKYKLNVLIRFAREKYGIVTYKINEKC